MILETYLISVLFAPLDIQKERRAEQFMAQMSEEYVVEEYQHLVSQAYCRVDPQFEDFELVGLGFWYGTSCGSTEVRLVWFAPLKGAFITADMLYEDLFLSCPEMLNDHGLARVPSYLRELE